ncbi:YcaQ family DNA glycosylase [Marivibrio halodurans]|uniref:YcaQ family DNA glycosylase n=1 Tax=Marivibrio halodurans TaxID=2039722 RepID=A0A8J7UZP5_9PROT|nr:crosslink repair DNA glycosylase YcaQ family protein [Marivibrio halodurans]MBP5855886.1 YcaQ family DNA glycosylase [Marivibrio halodurans]
MAKRLAGETLTPLQARRVALAHLGLHRRRPDGPVSAAQVRKTARALGVLQVDSVNVLERAHFLPLFSRLGAYDHALLEKEAYGGRRRSLFEYWGHECSLLPVELQPCFRWRMEDAARGIGIYGRLARFARENPKAIQRVRDEIADRGPVAASELTGTTNGPTDPWWGWSEAKEAAEFLFWGGEITTATRRTAGFTRIYDLTERVLPRAVVETPTPSREEAQRTLLRRAAGALGIATEPDLRDFYRLPSAESRARVAELVEEGALIPARVKGWKDPAYLVPDAGKRRLEGCTLLVPFDPVCWFRPRAERLFDFHYRLEIYTPAHKRAFGYYVLPIALDDRLAGRLDLKADREGRRLLVQGAFAEAGEPTGPLAERLAPALREMAGWLGLDDVSVAPNGDLARPLTAAL